MVDEGIVWYATRKLEKGLYVDQMYAEHSIALLIAANLMSVIDRLPS